MFELSRTNVNRPVTVRLGWVGWMIELIAYLKFAESAVRPFKISHPEFSQPSKVSQVPPPLGAPPLTYPTHGFAIATESRAT